jgi:hypothetical protein
VLIALVTTACGSDTPALDVTRVDSAGIEIVRNGGERALDWRLEPELTLGGQDDGPESFFRIHPASIAAHDGALYVLDPGNHRVLEFDLEGRHVRTLGGRGGGPGELEWPQSLMIEADGTLAIADISRQGLVRIASDGEPLENRVLEGWRGGRVAPYGGGLIAQLETGGPGEAESQLVHLAGDQRTPILSAPRPQLKPVDLGCVQISGMAPYFAPSLTWGTGADRLVVNQEAGYQLDVYSGPDLVRRIRRDVPARPATLELAIQEVGEKFEVTFGGGGSCVVPPEKVAEARGFAEFIPAIRRLAVAPDGTIWVQRFAVKGDDAAVDLFAADGEYLGTLPPGTPFPAAFLGPDRFATTEKDDLDVDHVVVYRVDRRARGDA